MSILGYQWYPKDFISDPDVMFMTAAERGVYRDLIDLAYINENEIKYSIEMLSRYTNSDIETVSKVLEMKGKKIGDIWTIPSVNKRIELMLRNRKNGEKGGRPKVDKKPKQNPDDNPKHNPPVKPNGNPDETQTQRQIEIESKIEKKKEIKIEGRKEEKPPIQQPIFISENDLNKILPDQIVKIETAIDILKSPRCQSWRDFIGMQQSIKADDMFVLFDKFEIHCKEQNNFEKTYKDAQNHFGHWIKKGLHNPKPQTENLNQSRYDIFDKNSKPQTPGDWVWFEKTSRWVDKKVLPKHMLRQVENN